MMKGNIHIAGGAVGDRFALSDASEHTRERQEELIRELESRRRQRAVAVTTDDGEVRAQLRRLGEPVTLFGEGPGDRRDRLRKELARLDAADGGALLVPEDAGIVFQREAVEQRELFYTEGSAALAAARYAIAEYSVPRAARRLRAARKNRTIPSNEGTASEGRDGDPLLLGLIHECARLDSFAEKTARMETEASLLGDDRPLCDVRFSRSDSGGVILTASWSGVVKLWRSENVRKALAVKASEDRITGCDLHPEASREWLESSDDETMDTANAVNTDATATTSRTDRVFMATASADGSASLWSADGKFLRALRGHVGRLGRARFFPSGAYVATAGFDKTWRLWDCETGTELLCQEGHSRAVYDVGFHPDGSLAASVGLESHGRVWDLRSGRNILNLKGHEKPVLCVDFSANGAHCATGSEDNTCKIWDLRNTRGCLYTVPAHAKSVTSVRFEPSSGGYFVSGSHDGDVKAWSGVDFSLRRRLRGHESRVAAVDVTAGGSMCVSVGHDRTVKLWRAGGKDRGARLEED
jgi:U4/U6 small nuclear ribonucleoprotein PRP4